METLRIGALIVALSGVVRGYTYTAYPDACGCVPEGKDIKILAKCVEDAVAASECQPKYSLAIDFESDEDYCTEPGAQTLLLINPKSEMHRMQFINVAHNESCAVYSIKVGNVPSDHVVSDENCKCAPFTQTQEVYFHAEDSEDKLSTIFTPIGEVLSSAGNAILITGKDCVFGPPKKTQLFQAHRGPYVSSGIHKGVSDENNNGKQGGTNGKGQGGANGGQDGTQDDGHGGRGGDDGNGADGFGAVGTDGVVQQVFVGAAGFVSLIAMAQIL